MKKLFILLAFTGIIGTAATTSIAVAAPSITFKTDDKKTDDKKDKKKEKACCKSKGEASGKACSGQAHAEEKKACSAGSGSETKACCKGKKAEANNTTSATPADKKAE